MCEDGIRKYSRHTAIWLSVFALLLLVQISPLWYSTPDTVKYLSVARNIARGAGLMQLGGQRLDFPPGYPLVISPTFLVADRPFLLLSILHWVLAVVLMLGVHRWMRAVYPETALWLTGAVMLHAGFGIHYRRFLTELTFMTALIWTVHALNAALTVRPARQAIRWTAVGGVLAALLVLIREAGGVVVAGFAVALLAAAARQRIGRGVAIVMLLIVTLPVSFAVFEFGRPLAEFNAARVAAKSAARSIDQPATYLEASVPIPAVTGQPVSDAVPYGDIIRVRVAEVGRLIVPGMLKAYGPKGRWLDVNMLVYVLVCALSSFGWWQLVRLRPDVLALTLPFHLGVYLVWPMDAGTRYLLPMLPVLLVCAWLPWRHRLRSGTVALFLIAHGVVATGYWVAIDLARARDCNADWEAVEQLAARVPASGSNGASTVGSDCVRLMLEFILDRPVEPQRQSAAVSDNIRWIVAPAAQDVPTGFVTRTSNEAYRLSVREP